MAFIKKAVRVFFIFAVLFLSVDILAVIFFAVFKPPTKQADVIVVMGAAINSPALRERSLKAFELYSKNLAPVIAVTGGKIAASDISEAAYAKKFLTKKAGDGINIVLEEQSGNTYENLKFLKNRLGEKPNIIVVSDNYHLARSVLTAKLMGYGQVSWQSPNSGYYPKKELFFHFLREIVALPTYVFRFLTGNLR